MPPFPEPTREEALERHIEWMASIVHAAYHREHWEPGSPPSYDFRHCTRSACEQSRRILEGRPVTGGPPV